VHVYKALGRAGDALGVYEAAWQADPQNLELAEGAFFCHARLGSFSEQQSAAMKMYKTFGDDLYLMWAVVSVLLQVRAGAEPRLLQVGGVRPSTSLMQHQTPFDSPHPAPNCAVTV
jgi:hypothetical protein